MRATDYSSLHLGLNPGRVRGHPSVKDIDGRVDVSVEDHTTGVAMIHPLVESYLVSRPSTAARALLRRMAGIYLDDPPTGTCSLVGQAMHKVTPLLLHDGSGQTPVPHHSGDFQIFYYKPAGVILDKRTGNLMHLASLLFRHPLPCLGQQPPLLLPVI